MGDNYKTIRHDDSYPMPVGSGRHNTHYKLSKEEFGALLEAFGKFVSKDVHIFLPKVLQRYLPELIKYCRQIKQGSSEKNAKMVMLWTHILHLGIMKFYYPELTEKEIPGRNSITDHIRGIHHSDEYEEILNPNFQIRPEIIMVYGETGIFSILTETFLKSYKERRRINIKSWEDALLVFSLNDDSNTNSDFVNKNIICKGKFLAVQIMRIFLCNILLSENSEEIFIPTDIYSEEEIAEYFKAHFISTEA